jgi:hypothetical protein
MKFKEWLKPSEGVRKLFSGCNKIGRKIVKSAFVLIYCVIAVYTTALTGCVGMMLTAVPPLTESLGYRVPNLWGVTTVGLNEGSYTWEAEKLNFWRTSMDFVNQPAIDVHAQAVDWLNIALSASVFGGIPLVAKVALKKLPKGAVSEKDHVKAVADAAKTG